MSRYDRLSQIAYIQLCNRFKVQDSQHAIVEEKIAIFLHVISHNDRFKKVKNRFQHSTQTLLKYFHEVLNGMMEFAKEVITLATLIKTLMFQKDRENY